ncbi:Protein of unknown function, partial [Cotesia congregata]
YRRYKMDPELNPTTAGNSLVYQAIQENNLEDLIKLLLEDGMNVNEPIITTGEFSGFTALHVACMKNRDSLVESLVNYCKADVNAMAADGTQPIHLACFYQSLHKSNSKIKTLVEANANVNAEFGKEIFSKHIKDEEWFPYFGAKMPLAAYTVIYDKPSIIYDLKQVNLNIISLTNKTLLMYAAENYYYEYISIIMSNIEDPELRDKLINHRDCDDVPLTHYPFYPKKYDQFAHRKMRVTFDYFLYSKFFSEVSKWGADMYALIKNDPVTFLPNLLVYRCCPMLLEDCLPYYTTVSLYWIVYYAALSKEESFKQYLARVHPVMQPVNNLSPIRENRKDCIDIAVKDLVFRVVFRLPVQNEDIMLMNKFIVSDVNLSDIVNDYRENFIEKELQERFIEFGDHKMTMYDFLWQVFDYKKLKFLMREENLLDALDKVVIQNLVFRSAFRLPVQKEEIKLMDKLIASDENLRKINHFIEFGDNKMTMYDFLMQVFDYKKL